MSESSPFGPPGSGWPSGASEPSPFGSPPAYGGSGQTPGLAIASLVLGLLWLGGVGAVLAVLFGHLALARLRRVPGPKGGRGIAIAGTVVGYVGIVTPALVLLAATLVGSSGSDDDHPLAQASTTTSAPDDTTVTTDATETTETTTEPAGTAEPATPTTVELTECGSFDPTSAEDPDVLDREPPVPEPPPADTPTDALDASILIAGNGPPVNCGDTVMTHYVGVLADGSVFDSSWERDEPLAVTLSRGQVIQGWDEGLIGARVGERRHLVIGADYAYGARGADVIPPNAPLAFDVDIVAISR
jgi:peptidylprolyl isomerase